MRVIRTEMYFDDSSVNAADAHHRKRSMRRFNEKKNHGLAFAWFRNDGDDSFSIKSHKWFEGKEIGIDQIDLALDLLLRDVDEFEITRMLSGESVRNPEIIDYVLQQSIILEHSPPVAIPFKNLLKKTNSALLIGAYVGYASAGDNPALMILTVPGGIIVVGSALGVADAMAYGLNKQIKRLFDRK
jgi:hypothetical protein